MPLELYTKVRWVFYHFDRDITRTIPDREM